MSKYCGNCGNELSSDSKFCTYCGAQINEVVETEVVEENETSEVTVKTDETKTNGFAIAGFVLALVSLFINLWGLIGILAVIFSGIGISCTGPNKEKGRGLAVAGLIIGIISVIWGFITILALL